MKTTEFIGYKRENLSKSDTKRIRDEGSVPCVLYGGKEPVHFYSPAILFRDIVYTDEAHFVNLDIEGQEFTCILQDIQFHPVSENILHADFLMLRGDKKVKMDIPVRLHGLSPGVEKGGNLMHKRRLLKVMALPENMPEFISLDISNLDFGKAIKVGEVEEKDFQILDSKIASVAVVETPRALKVEEEEVELEEGAELEEGEAEEGATAEGEAPTKEEQGEKE